MNNLAKKRLRAVAAFTLWGVVIGAVLGPIIGQFDGRPLLFSATCLTPCAWWSALSRRAAAASPLALAP